MIKTAVLVVLDKKNLTVTVGNYNITIFREINNKPEMKKLAFGIRA